MTISKKPSHPYPAIGWQTADSAVIVPKGFREYDGRWIYPRDLNLSGAVVLGHGLGTLMHEQECAPQVIIGHDYRSYSQPVAHALTLGLMHAGIQVFDIGTVISPIAYFCRDHLGIEAVAMVTASHNPNGWTGLKAGLRHPLTLDTEQMRRLRDIVLSAPLNDRLTSASTSSYQRVEGIFEAYADDLCRRASLGRNLKVVCATGNGTAGKFAPDILSRMGLNVVPLHTDPNWEFPHYNPNPESLEMLDDIGRLVVKSGADIGFGFDGDGDRLGVVDNLGQPVFSDKVGLLIALAIAERIPQSKFIADIKSTGLFATHPRFQELGCQVEYWKTGHSHMKCRLAETGAIAAFEKSGHFYFGKPIGRGYDDALMAALEICCILDRTPSASLSELIESLPKSWMTPTMSPYCADEEKYQVVAHLISRIDSLAQSGGSLGGQKIVDVLKINGARCILANGSWALVRASSNTPNLVVVCESTTSDAEMRAIFHDFNALISQEKLVGEYDQRI